MSLFSEFNLDKQLRSALDDLGYTTATHIQDASFSVIMSGRDVVGIAQTGTGKTLAYLLPIMRLWKFSKERHPQALVIAPTRELVEQIASDAQDLVKYMNFKVVAAFGGTNIRHQIEAVEAGCDLVVATPRRLLDLCLKGALKLKNIKRFVIDEVDEMLQLGFAQQLMHVFDLLPARRQNLMFSATLTDEVEALIGEFFNGPLKIEAAPSGTPLEKISQVAYRVPNFLSKVSLLHHILYDDKSMDKVLIFVSTKKLADILYEEINDQYQDQVGVIHANKSQNYRFDSVRRFKEGTYRILIATDLISRGIDIVGVSHVINFDMPIQAEGYIHRIGRTGRAEANGVAVSFITSDDEMMTLQIESLMNLKIDILSIPKEVSLTEELIEYERPQILMKNQLTKAPKIVAGAAFEKKKIQNNPTNTSQGRSKRKRSKKSRKSKKW